MRYVDARAKRCFDLRAQFSFDGLGIGAAGVWDVWPEVAGRVGQSGRQGRRGKRSPAVGFLLAGQRQMHAKVKLRVGLRHFYGLGKPGARRHDRAASARAERRQLRKSCVGTVAHAYVVLVDDDHFSAGLDICEIHDRSYHSQAMRATRSVRSSRSISSRRKWAATLPCASTVNSSATESAWRKLCVMSMTAWPWSRAWRMWSRTLPAWRTASADVGSSSTRSDEPKNI